MHPIRPTQIWQCSGHSYRLTSRPLLVHHKTPTLQAPILIIFYEMCVCITSMQSLWIWYLPTILRISTCHVLNSLMHTDTHLSLPGAVCSMVCLHITINRYLLAKWFLQISDLKMRYVQPTRNCIYIKNPLVLKVELTL